MRIGVMSDTHDNTKLMQNVADVMANQFKVETMIHLGDDYADTKRLDTHGTKLFAVPGIYEAAWKDRSIPHRIIKEFGGTVFLMTHTTQREDGDTKGDINPQRARSDFDVDVLLHGHTHSYGASQSEDGLIIINPGHLKSMHDRNSPASYAIIDIEKRRLFVRFIGIDGKILDKKLFEVDRARLNGTDESSSGSGSYEESI